MTFNHMKCTEARAQTLASRLYLLSASPGYRDTSAFGAVATLSTSSTIIHLLHGHPFSDTFCCSYVQYQPNSFISTSSPTCSRFCHIDLKAQDYREVLHILCNIVLSFLCWYKFNHQDFLLVLLQANASESLLPAFPVGFFYIDIISNYNSLALSHPTVNLDYEGSLATSSATSQSPLFAATNFPRHPELRATSYNSNSNLCCFHGYSFKVSPPPGYKLPSRYIFHGRES